MSFIFAVHVPIAGLALLPLRVMDRPGELKTAARP